MEPDNTSALQRRAWLAVPAAIALTLTLTACGSTPAGDRAGTLAPPIDAPSPTASAPAASAPAASAPAASAPAAFTAVCAVGWDGLGTFYPAATSPASDDEYASAVEVQVTNASQQPATLNALTISLTTDGLITDEGTVTGADPGVQLPFLFTPGQTIPFTVSLPLDGGTNMTTPQYQATTCQATTS